MPLMEDNTRPPFSPDEARAIAETCYGIQPAALRELPAELDRNFLLRADAGDGYVLKIAHRSVSESALDLQNKTLRHLRGTLDVIPELIAAGDDADIVRVSAADGETYRARLLRYIEGVPLSEFRPHSDELLADIGARLGLLSARMQDFNHAEKRLGYRWHIGNLGAVAGYGRDLPPDKRALLDYFVGLYEAQAQPALPDLRHSFIYNDPNDSNILVRAAGPEPPTVTGLIDFGDMVYAPTVADLALALAYIMMDAERPLDKAAPVIGAYNHDFPLTDAEIRLLYPLIAARLCLSVCISWFQQGQEPDNRHLSISEEKAWDLLATWRDIHPRLAHYSFRAACGLPACPRTATLVDWLGEQDFAPILGRQLAEDDFQLLDFGISSRLLARVSDLRDPSAYEQPLREAIGGRAAGIGHYNEARPVYLADMFAVDNHEWRTVHLGVDLFAPPGTPIYAPLAGSVHAVVDNAGEQDYGPTLILKHEPAQGPAFYTLYGHLAPDALERWSEGRRVAAGELLAHIGDYPLNGNWAPHLHFQIIADMLDYAGNFPGVCSPRGRAIWTSLSPDPNLILRLPGSITAPTKPSRAELLARRGDALNPALSLSYRQPLKIERGYLQNLYDENGQPYLDCVNNVPHVGHSHPRVIRAAQEQMALLNTNTRYLHDTIVEYAEALAATLPAPLSVCFFVNSGSEANELALRLATAYTGGTDFIVIDHAYHGHTSALIEISPYKFQGAGGRGQADHAQVAEMPDGFRGARRGFGADAGEYYARSVSEAVDRIRARGRQPAAFFAEGIMGCGGQMPLPEGYLKRAYAFVREAGGLCVADEVQTGFGRVGSQFWSFELSGVSPDIVTLGKPMGNGHPLGAVVTTPEIADAFNNGMEYFNTFGGNPVSCAVGLEVLRIIQDEGLQRRALDVGSYWLEKLRALSERFPLIGQARGSGLFLGVELTRDRATLEPADWEAAYIVERMKGRGILAGVEGPRHNVLKLKPPLVFQRRDVDLFMAVFADVLGDTVLRVG